MFRYRTLLLAAVGSLLFASAAFANEAAGELAAHPKDLFSLNGLFTFANLFSLLVLSVLEIIFAVDNLVFMGLSINGLKEDPVSQRKARRIGLVLGALVRIALLAVAAFATSSMEGELFGFPDPFKGGWHAVAIKDIILFGGGVFLVYNSATHIFDFVQGKGHGATSTTKKKVTLASVLRDLVWINFIFSFDSVFTAVGTCDSFYIMTIAILASIAVMAFCAKPIADFLSDNPAFNILALAFLMVVGVHLSSEGWGYHIPKSLIYAPGSFALAVLMLHYWQQKNLEKREAAKS